jgi:hypothetical protein
MSCADRQRGGGEGCGERGFPRDDPRVVRVGVRYFDGCPNWRVVVERLRIVLTEMGSSDVEVELERIETLEQAETVAFRGSPTVLVDGRDPFLDEAAPVGLMCRIYRSPDGFAGAPSLDQLRAVLAHRRSRKGRVSHRRSSDC